MNTTSIFVELVIIGMHSLLGIVLLVMSFIDLSKIDYNKLLSLNIALPVLAVAYVLGIIVDRFADYIFINKDISIRPNNDIKDAPSLLSMRYYILHNSKDIYSQLEYARSRLRIVRASVFNFLFIMVSSILFVSMQVRQNSIVHAVLTYAFIALSGTLLSYGSYRSWLNLVKSYGISTLRAYEIIKKQSALKDASK